MTDNHNLGTENTENATIIEERITRSNGETTVRKYAKGRLLGKGGFAKCYEVTNLETKRILAAKIIEKASLKKSRARQKLISEIKIHKSNHHANIVNFEHVFEDQDNVYILLEICTNQTLNELLKRRKRLTELEVQCYLVQLVHCLKYLHANRIIHRDLKLGNIFLNEKMEIKVGDFGLACKLEFDGEKRRTVCGTPNYIAPEILENKDGHSYEVDVWSVGVIIYTMLIGKPPFETPDVKTTYQKIKANNYSFPDHVPLSEPAKNLIRQILLRDPLKRLTLDDILASPFLNHGGTIPKLLPVSTLACPPSASYIKQFMPDGVAVKLTAQPQRLIETAPYNPSSKMSSNLLATDKVALKTEETNLKLEKQSSKEVLISSNKMGTMQFNMTGSATNLKGSTQQLETKFAQGLQTIPSKTNFGMTGAIDGFSAPQKPTSANEIRVKKWVDYSSKYGLGYLLSNGQVGIYFNDSTKIIVDTKTKNFNYMDRRPADKQDVVSTYNMDNYPDELKKKVTLVQHFRKYLEEDNKEDNNQIEEEYDAKYSGVYVKKWMRTKHALMFRLSNKIVQVNFTDHTEIILNSENKLVTYLNKKGVRSNHPLSTALESSDTEMAKRLKYTKEILTHLLTQNNAHGGAKVATIQV
jgi:polo-like kinase 1